ncbi:hypothetical protein KAU43_03235 [candidate division WOR-3 bacterium]|jgi:glycerate dehydrogenase|nr:hypothetical protein [candidate division WOR-3 bacterium]
MQRELLISINRNKGMYGKIKEYLDIPLKIVFLDNFHPEMVECIVCFQWNKMIDEKYFKNFTNIKFVHTIFAGVNHLPKWLFKKDVEIITASGAMSDYIAEHALALLLAGIKNLKNQHEDIRNGIFNQGSLNGTLFNKTVGILGYGNIGKALYRIIKPFGVNIMAIKKYWSEEESHGLYFTGTLNDLDKVFINSDYIIITLPLTTYTRGIIDKNILKHSKNNSVLVNVARGKIIVEKDLYEFLNKRNDTTACLDVWWHYPNDGSNRFKQDSPFYNLKNCICTAHSAALCENYEEKSIQFTLGNLSDYYKTGRIKNRIIKGDYII